MLLNLLEKILDVYFALVPRHKPSFECIQSARLIAHRGAHDNTQGIIENTFAAFDLARDRGCWGLEFDVRATADKVLVVNHDATLKRLWGHDQAIAHLSFNELRALVPNIPSLKEVVSAYGHCMHLLIELKEPFQDEDVLVQALQNLSAGEDYHLLTLTPSIFYSLSQFPKDALLLVAYNNVNELCQLSLEEHYGGVLGHFVLVTNQSVTKLRAAKQIVGVGMVDSKYSLYRELNRGINWIFTNRAALMCSYLSKRY